MQILDHWNIQPSLDDILRAQGADPDVLRARRPALIKVAEWVMTEGAPSLKPLVAFEEYSVKSLTHERLALNPNHTTSTMPSVSSEASSPYFLSGPLIARHLAGASSVVIVLCTVGSQLEEIASQMMPDNPLEGWALDSLGSAAVELLSTLACNHLEQLASQQGLRTTIPLSPGMIGWPVELGQPQIFSLLDSHSIGVSLTPVCLMLPRKTISLVIGIGSGIQSSEKTCDYCSMNEVCKYKNHFQP